MAALLIFGLQFAPANHAAALGPGVVPAWVALLGFLVFSRRPSARTIVGAALCAIGVATLTTWSASATQPAVLTGDAMFLAASALGALYLLQLRSWGIGALQSAAIVLHQAQREFLLEGVGSHVCHMDRHAREIAGSFAASLAERGVGQGRDVASQAGPKSEQHVFEFSRLVLLHRHSPAGSQLGNRCLNDREASPRHGPPSASARVGQSLVMISPSGAVCQTAGANAILIFLRRLNNDPRIYQHFSQIHSGIFLIVFTV
jgi:hypothetical protein